MGIAVLGYSKDDKISWKFPGGNKDIVILNIRQNNITKLNIVQWNH